MSGSDLTHRAVRSGGARVARLDRYPGGQLALARVIERTLPRLFEPAAATDLEATFALEMTHPGGRRPDVLGLAIQHGSLTLTRGRPANPGATVTIGADDMIRLATGDVGWPQLLAENRLSLSGDPFLALRFPRMFALPAEPGTPLILSARR